MKKFLSRKRKILLGIIFLALLTIPLAIVLITTGKKRSSSVSSSTPNLTQLRKQKVDEVEADLWANNYSPDSLLQVLKTEDNSFTGKN